MTDSAAASTVPSPTAATAASMSGVSQRSGPTPGTVARSARTTAAVGGGRSERCPHDPMRAGGGEHLDREHPPHAVDRPAQLAGRRPAHRDVVLLHGRATGWNPRSPGPPAASAHSPVPPGCTAQSSARNPPPGRPRGTPAARASGPGPASGRCGVRPSTPGPRRRSRGSPGRTRPGHRGSCRCSRSGRRRAPTGCRSRSRARCRRPTAACATVSRNAPATCGAQRSE